MLKKRFWFEETTKIKDAHFIWTQIKNENIFQSQTNFKNEEGYIDEKPTNSQSKKPGFSLSKLLNSSQGF